MRPGLTDFALDRALYTPERLMEIAKEAMKENSAFTLEDRIGLVNDALALAKAGYLNVSSILSLYDILRHEKECECAPLPEFSCNSRFQLQIWCGAVLRTPSVPSHQPGTKTRRSSSS